MNKSDSERIASVLEKVGYRQALNITEADLIVVNACSVRQSAIDRIYGLSPKFEKLKTKNNKLKTILTGCVLKEDKKKFSKSFNLILNINDLPRLPNILNTKYKIQDKKNCKIKVDQYLKIQPIYQSSFSAYIPIMTGCNNFCSFCVVPYTRGREISRPAEEIICEAENLVKRGYKEIWLLGQNVNSYKFKEINFPKLLRMVNDIPGNFWIRFTSSHPKPSTRAKLGAGLVRDLNEVSGAGDFSWDELIETMVKCEKVTEYLNLPVQSGDNEILKKMNRPYIIKQYKEIVREIREKVSEISLSTDVIVGFPGETEKQFQNTVNLFKEIRYDMAYIAKYSARSATAAANLKDDVSWQEKEKRWKILSEILKETALEKNKEYLGKILDVLVGADQRGYLRGKTRNYKTIKFESPKNLIGQFVKIKVVDALPWGLKGEII